MQGQNKTICFLVVLALVDHLSLYMAPHGLKKLLPLAAQTSLVFISESYNLDPGVRLVSVSS